MPAGNMDVRLRNAPRGEHAHCSENMDVRLRMPLRVY